MKGKSHLILLKMAKKKMQKNGQNKLGSFFILPLFLIHFGASLARGDPSKFTHSNRTLESLLCPRGKRHSNPAAEITVSAEKKKSNTAAPGNTQARWKAARSPAAKSQFNSVHSMSIPELHPLRKHLGHLAIPQSSNAREEFQGPKLPRLLWPRPIS